MKNFLYVLVIALLVGCNGVTFNTNAGSYGKSVLQESAVDVYSANELEKYKIITLGVVESVYCQHSIDQPAPRKKIVIKDMKVKTQNLGGNGLLVESCGQRESVDCIALVECSGTAYVVSYKHEYSK